MILKVTKFVIKVIIGLVLGVVIGVYLVAGTYTAYKTANEDPHKNMSFVIKDVGRCESYSPGTGLQCPICKKNFIKEDIPFCSHKCEEKYLAMKREYDNAKQSEKNLKRMGKNYK